MSEPPPPPPPYSELPEPYQYPTGSPQTPQAPPLLPPRSWPPPLANNHSTASWTPPPPPPPPPPPQRQQPWNPPTTSWSQQQPRSPSTASWQPPQQPRSPSTASWSPPLPPRTTSSISSASWSPPPSHASPSSYKPHLAPDHASVSTTFLHDPRSSSQASLLPAVAPTGGRRTLLLVYIHGFMGNETSFQSFPAHLHNLLTVTLSDGYLVHTKVYPKFKTRNAINVASLEFSRWLSAFETPTTDVVLLGHSMGGILAAEVILLPSFYSPGARRHPGILGMIAFDSPFLGMSPGIISSGIASLFRPVPASPPAAEDSSSSNEVIDPLFGMVPKRNFTIVESRKPANPWESTLHFISKHHEHLTQATGNYLLSHLEFGSCLADPIGLLTRYKKIRVLEDGDQTPDGAVDRVRFANYYTISYGRDKGTVAQPPPGASSGELAEGEDIVGGSGGEMAGLETAVEQLEIVGEDVEKKSHSRTLSGSSMGSIQQLEPEPLDYSDPSYPTAHDEFSQITPQMAHAGDIPDPEAPPPPSVEIVPPTPIAPPSLPPLDEVASLFPPLSPPPPAPTLQEIPENVERHLRKALERENRRLSKEHERQMKEYGKLVRGRERAIARIYHDREKVRRERCKDKGKERSDQDRGQQKAEETREREAQKAREAQEKGEQKAQEAREKEERERQRREEKAETKRNKPPRQRRFCIIPSKPDYTWTPVEMKGVDEVGAHCGLFFVGDVYAKLVGDVAGRIEEWVGEEQSKRVAQWSAEGDDGTTYGYPDDKTGLVGV